MVKQHTKTKKMTPNTVGTQRTAEQTRADFVEWENKMNIRGERLERAQYHHLGEFKNIVPVPHPELVWTGGISVANRIGTDFTRQQVQEALRARNLHRYYVRS